MAYYYEIDNKRVHSNYFPHNFRALIVGQSGAGKTALLMRMLLEDNLLNYDKLYIFAKSLYQPEYRVLESGLKNNLPKSDIKLLMNCDKLFKKHNSSLDEIDDICEQKSNYNDENDIPRSDIDYEFSSNPNDIPDPQELNKITRNLIVFDDVMTDKKQTTAENYYTRSRSANCDCIYLSQNYTHLPLHTIRSNSNFMIFFKSSPLVVEQLYRNFSSIDMNINDWKKFCNDAWKNKFGFIVTDFSRNYDSGNKYRKQLELNVCK